MFLFFRCTFSAARGNNQYLDTSNNRTLAHGDLATQILGYDTERKVESTVSSD